MTPLTALTKTGLLTIAAALIAFTSTATPASAEVPTGTTASRAVGIASTEYKLADLWEPITVTSEEAPAITVVRPMAEGTYRDTSLYGPRWGIVHTGTDMAATAGTPIHAIADGEVIHAGEGRDGRSGQLVIIHHVIAGQDVWSWYGHMYTDGVNVAAGDTVTAGQPIAEVGSNGNSTGPHLHFEIHVGELENHVDPLHYLGESEAPFPAAA